MSCTENTHTHALTQTSFLGLSIFFLRVALICMRLCFFSTTTTFFSFRVHPLTYQRSPCNYRSFFRLYILLLLLCFFCFWSDVILFNTERMTFLTVICNAYYIVPLSLTRFTFSMHWNLKFMHTFEGPMTSIYSITFHSIAYPCGQILMNNTHK